MCRDPGARPRRSVQSAGRALPLLTGSIFTLPSDLGVVSRSMRIHALGALLITALTFTSACATDAAHAAEVDQQPAELQGAAGAPSAIKPLAGCGTAHYAKALTKAANNLQLHYGGSWICSWTYTDGTGRKSGYCSASGQPNRSVDMQACGSDGWGHGGDKWSTAWECFRCNDIGCQDESC